MNKGVTIAEQSKQIGKLLLTNKKEKIEESSK